MKIAECGPDPRPTFRRTAEAQEGAVQPSLQAATGQVEKTHRVGEVRKDIARIKTVLRGKTAAA